MTTREAIRIVRGAQAARASVLARKPLDEITGSPELQSSIERLFGKPMTLDQVVATILNDVRNDGDTAVQHYSTLLDGGAVEPLRVSAEEIERAWQSTPQPLRDALTHAAERIAAFHQLQKAGSWLNWGDEGTLGQMVRPLERVGIYAPNGRCAHPVRS